MLKISVVTPSYNQGAYIEETIQSVLKQNYANFEHIIMDGGSTDNTLEILKRYPHLIWKSEKDNGQTHALNKALKLTSGDIIAWINSDDVYCENAFGEINHYFTENQNHYCLIGNLLYIDEKNNLLQHNNAAKVNFNGLLDYGQCVQQVSTFFRKEVFEKVGLLDESYHYSMDHELWVRVAYFFEFYTINSDLAKFRKYKETKTGSHTIKFVKEIIRLKIKHRGKLFTLYNFRLLLMFLKEPLKKIGWLRKFIRKLKGKPEEYWYYN